MIGCKPQLTLFFSDPLLALKVFLGPCTPPQYRLMGPNPWAGAKQAIEKALSNTIYATKTRDTEKPASFPVMKVAMILAIILAIIAITYLVN